MKKISRYFLLQICCLLMVHIGCAQSKNNVVKLHAFITKTYAGNIQTDSNGNEITPGMDVVHHVYAETTGKYLPTWNMVYTNSGVFAIQATEITSGKHEAGLQNSDGAAVKLAAKRGNRLWQLELVPVKAKLTAAMVALLKKYPVVVTSEWNGRQYTHTIAKEVELKPVYFK